MKGASPIPQVAPEISHQISLNDDLDHLAHLFLARVTRYSSGLISQAAFAGFFSGIEFSNPSTSGVLVQVERLLFYSQAGAINQRANLYAAAIAGGTTGSSFPLDTRESGGKRSALVNSANNNIAGISGSTIEYAQIQAAQPHPLEILNARGVVIAPGQRLTIFGNLVNQSCSCMLIHRERAVSPAELLL